MKALRPGSGIKLLEDNKLKKSILDFKYSMWTEGPGFDPSLIEYTTSLRAGDAFHIEKNG